MRLPSVIAQDGVLIGYDGSRVYNSCNEHDDVHYVNGERVDPETMRQRKKNFGAISGTVNFDDLLLDALFYEEFGYLDPLISLELNDLAKLFVCDERSVASKFLMKQR